MISKTVYSSFTAKLKLQKFQAGGQIFSSLKLFVITFCIWSIHDFLKIQNISMMLCSYAEILDVKLGGGGWGPSMPLAPVAKVSP